MDDEMVRNLGADDLGLEEEEELDEFGEVVKKVPKEDDESGEEEGFE